MGGGISRFMLQPYQLVKDLRNKQSTNPASVLDGNSDQFRGGDKK